VNIPGLPIWSAALRGVMAGTRNARIYVSGDSVTRGLSELASNRQLKSWPTQMGALATAAGFRCNNQSFFGGGGIPSVNTTGLATYDTRVTLSGAMQFNGAAASLFSTGGALLDCSSAGSVTFAPEADCDTFDVYYPTKSGSPLASGTFTYKIDGGTDSAPVSQAGANGVSKLTIPVALGAHSLTLSWASGRFTCIGVNSFDSSQKRIDIFNDGVIGQNTVEHNYSVYPWSQNLAPGALAGDLLIYALCENDLLQGRTVLATQTNAQGSIDAAKAAGMDVLLVNAIPVFVGPSVINQDAMAQGIRDLAATNDIPIFDIYARWGGLYNAARMTDGNHPNSGALGYGDIAAGVANRIFGI